MTNSPTPSMKDKPIRLYFKTYLQLIRNAVGTEMFRNFYVVSEERGEFDALDDGDSSCAFFVSSVLVIFKKLNSIHGTVESTVKDLQESGWKQVDSPQAGDVLVWEAIPFDEGPQQHIGFSLGDGRAVSTSASKKTVQEHDEHFGTQNRKIVQIFRTKWE